LGHKTQKENGGAKRRHSLFGLLPRKVKKVPRSGTFLTFLWVSCQRKAL
jgi:hypothetical protein